MSNNRIQHNGTSPEENGPQTMEELLGRAHNKWKFKEKDEAFALVLRAIAMASQGVAVAMRDSAEASRKLIEIESKITPR